jgi:hypothetical protein
LFWLDLEVAKPFDLEIEGWSPATAATVLTRNRPRSVTNAADLSREAAQE